MKNIRLFSAATFVLYLLSMTACSNGDAVTSQEPETMNRVVSDEQDYDTGYKKNDVFTSMDGTVEFTWNIAVDSAIENLPILDVSVHKFSEEEARRIANVLFDGAVFYEPEDAFEEEYSKAELQKKLDIWKEYADIEKMTWLYPYRNRPDDNYIPHEVELVQRFIDEYTEKLNHAPIEKKDAPYDWVFRQDGLYGKGYLTDCEYNGLPYRIRSNGKQYSVYLYTGAGPSNIELDHYRALLCRTEKPDETLLREIRRKAETIMAEMELGEWAIEACTVREQNVGTKELPVMEYDICIDIVPSYLGIPTMSWNGSNSWSDQGIRMNFAPGGQLLNFSMENMYDFHSFSDGNSIMEMAEILSAAQALLEQKTHMDLEGHIAESQETTILCKVDLCELRYGLLLTQHPSHAGKMQYIPSVILNAEVSYAADKAGDTFIPGEAMFGVPLRRVLTISAINGTEVAYYRSD